MKRRALADSSSHDFCVIGAGPAGLAAAHELTLRGARDVAVIEATGVVGGLSRTDVHDEARFDVGPHRFFTKNAEVNALWHELLGADFRPVDRLTRIYYRGKFFNYPIKAFDAFSKLGPVASIHAVISYLGAQLDRDGEPETFEDWVSTKFGRKLYETFFKTYTEKVWGIPCREIGADWAAQRIKGLDIWEVLKNAVVPAAQQKVKTLVEQFDYPRLGAGQMYEAMCSRAADAGAEVLLDHRVVAFHLDGDRVKEVSAVGSDGEEVTISAGHFFTSAPITQVVTSFDPPEAEPIRRSAEALYYRDHITVNLLVARDGLFPDQWIYAHAPEVEMARVANYGNFSADMVNHQRRSALGVEYFVFKGDAIWNKRDEELEQLAVAELDELGLVRRGSIERAWVVRETECYPTYYLGFEEHFDRLRRRLDEIGNLHPIGRGGMYKYNNQDHSIVTGMLAARNVLDGERAHRDLWSVNVDAEYHESASRKPRAEGSSS